MNLLLNGYVSAEITLFWVSENEDAPGWLVFAVTELIPKNQLPSLPLGGGKSKYLYATIRNRPPKKHVYCRRYFCAAEEAVTCFEKHNWTELPDGPNVICSEAMQKEPQAGLAVVLPKGHVPLNRQAAGISMVLPDRPTSFRVSAFLDSKAETENRLSSSEKNALVKFIRKYCDIDLGIYNEFFGANILCMQNPILWDIKTCVDEDNKLFRFLLLPRDGETIASMRAMIFSKNAFGTTTFESYPLSSEVFSLPIPDNGSEPELYLWDSAGNLLETLPLSFFGGRIWSSFKHRILPNGKHVPIWPEQYYRARIKDKSALQKAERYRLYHQLEKNLEFCYFKEGETKKAQEIIGTILSRAGLNITICDPYLDERGFDRYIAGWIKCINLTIYASKKQLEKIHLGSSVTLQEHLEDRINLMVTKKEVETAQLFGIPGSNNGFVHDRFVATENGVWCLGSSLNSFADRDTVLFKSPNPEAFFSNLDEWKSGKAKLLREW